MKKYTKKQIQEAIEYWKGVLAEDKISDMYSDGTEMNSVRRFVDGLVQMVNSNFSSKDIRLDADGDRIFAKMNGQEFELSVRKR